MEMFRVSDVTYVLRSYHSLSSSSLTEWTSGMKGLSVSGCVSNIFRNVTVPTELGEGGDGGKGHKGSFSSQSESNCYCYCENRFQRAELLNRTS